VGERGIEHGRERVAYFEAGGQTRMERLADSASRSAKTWFILIGAVVAVIVVLGVIAHFTG
jgi:hypothetical protein